MSVSRARKDKQAACDRCGTKRGPFVSSERGHLCIDCAAAAETESPAEPPVENTKP